LNPRPLPFWGFVGPTTIAITAMKPGNPYQGNALPG